MHFKSNNDNNINININTPQHFVKLSRKTGRPLRWVSFQIIDLPSAEIIRLTMKNSPAKHTNQGQACIFKKLSTVPKSYY